MLNGRAVYAVAALGCRMNFRSGVKGEFVLNRYAYANGNPVNDVVGESPKLGIASQSLEFINRMGMRCMIVCQQHR